jgi:hypothetical protein
MFLDQVQIFRVEDRTACTSVRNGLFRRTDLYNIGTQGARSMRGT